MLSQVFGRTSEAKYQQRKKEALLTIFSGFAIELERKISSTHDSTTLQQDLYKHIDMLSVQSAKFSDNSRKTDKLGTMIWNLSVNLCRTNRTSMHIICLVRVFSFFILDHCLGAGPISFKNAGQLSLAERIVERLAWYEDTLKGIDTPLSQDDERRLYDLSDRYKVLRIILAWKQDRLDIALIWAEQKLALMQQGSNIDSIMRVGMAFYDIGEDQIEVANPQAAIQWLEKAHEVLTLPTEGSVDKELGGFVLGVKLKLVEALIATKNDDMTKRAWVMASGLERVAGSDLGVIFLRLEILDGSAATSVDQLKDAILACIREAPLTEQILRKVLFYVYKLRERSACAAHTVLRSALVERLITSGNQSWIERTFTTLVWNLTTNSPDQGLASLNDVLETLQMKLPYPIGPSAAYAARMLIWRQVETFWAKQNYVKTSAWCQAGLHQIFGRVEDATTGKLQRKLMLCALASAKYSDARTVYGKMSSQIQNAEATQYILYKVGLYSEDTELSSMCLEAIYCSDDANMVYACILEAQKYGQPQQALAGLLRLLQRSNLEWSLSAYLPALIRGTARLLINNMASCHVTAKNRMSAICQLFEKAAKWGTECAGGSKGSHFAIQELDWFSRNIYNLALSNCTAAGAEQSLSLIRACLEFTDLYPKKIKPSDAGDVSLRRAFCNFVACALLVRLARAAESQRMKHEFYRDVRKHAQGFDTEFSAQLGCWGGAAKEDLERQASTLLALDFEAAVYLESWEEALQIARSAVHKVDPHDYVVFADIILSSKAPIETIVLIVQHIINATWNQEEPDLTKLSRWIRCLFQLTSQSNSHLAGLILDKAHSVADCAESNMPYPAEELEWLASTAFNRAVDFYLSARDADCHRWFEKALALAGVLARSETTGGVGDGGGSLLRLLREKYEGLEWGEGELEKEKERSGKE